MLKRQHSLTLLLQSLIGISFAFAKTTSDCLNNGDTSLAYANVTSEDFGAAVLAALSKSDFKAIQDFHLKDFEWTDDCLPSSDAQKVWLYDSKGNPRSKPSELFIDNNNIRNSATSKTNANIAATIGDWAVHSSVVWPSIIRAALLGAGIHIDGKKNKIITTLTGKTDITHKNYYKFKEDQTGTRPDWDNLLRDNIWNNPSSTVNIAYSIPGQKHPKTILDYTSAPGEPYDFSYHSYYLPTTEGGYSIRRAHADKWSPEQAAMVYENITDVWMIK